MKSPNCNYPDSFDPNAPIAAVTFTIEEVVGDLDQAVLTWIVVAAAIAAAIERAILDAHPVFTITKNYGLDHASSLLSYAAGAGGLFAPSLFIGGMLGGVFGYVDTILFHHSSVDVGAFALVGMGAVFAGIVRAPITSVLIIFEMTGSYGLILPLMISNMTAFALARHFRPVPVYEALLHQDRIYLPRKGRLSHALEQLRVGSAMTTKPITLPGNALVTDALRQAENDEFSTYPVVDDDAGFIGFVTEARLRRTVAEGGVTQRVSAIAQSSPHVSTVPNWRRCKMEIHCTNLSMLLRHSTTAARFANTKALSSRIFTDLTPYCNG